MALDELVKAFEQLFGKTPAFSCTAPGRVNLIGEHVDYSGYSVLPMAIEQSICAVIRCTPQEPVLKLRNIDPKYEPYTGLCETMVIDPSKPRWYHYFLCGYRGMWEHLTSKGGARDTKPVGMEVLVRGSVPPSAGLSSSSALVCCAALATLKANTGRDFDTVSRKDLAEICAACERYIGTQGGGMDQAICFLAEPGKAKLIEFHPLRSTDVQLPEGACFVIANCCVEMNKAATSHFNERVVECRLAAQVLAASKQAGEWEKVRTLGALQQVLNVPLQDMGALVDAELHHEPYTLHQIRDLLSISSDAEFVEKCLTGNTKHMTTFKLYQRAKHCYEEAYRVYQFAEVCRRCSEGDISNNEALAELGALTNASHESCSKMYECSCAELDRLVSVCRSAGALGSRLTGAGWGGCTVSLVKRENLDAFMVTVKEQYYAHLAHGACPDLTLALFATTPAQGAQCSEL